MSWTVKDLAGEVGAKFSGDGTIEIHSAAPIDTAQSGQLSFLSNPAYKKFLTTTGASALVVAPGTDVNCPAAIISQNPYLTFSKIINLLYPLPYENNPGIHPTAIVDPEAELSEDIEIGPRVVIEDGVKIGQGTIIRAGCFIGRDTVIGENCQFMPNVSIMHGTKIGNRVVIHSGTVIGSDGFGFAPGAPGEEYTKIRQVGWVEIQDNVEIGANTTVDRGAIGPTVIERGVKIDNLVMIAHNVRVGENSIVVAQVGISGSSKLGRGVILAGQVGVTGHIKIGDGTIIGAQSGVSKSLEGGKVYFGCPAKPIMETKRIEAALRQLPELIKRVRQLEKKPGKE